MVVLYASANAYLIDAFPAYVASALAAKTVVRSGMGAAMVLFIPQMFRGLGNGGAASLLGGVAILMVGLRAFFQEIRVKQTDKPGFASWRYQFPFYSTSMARV